MTTQLPGLQAQVARDDLHRKLTQVMQTNAKRANDLLAEFNRQENTAQARLMLTRQLIALLEDTLSAGDWDSSLLLHNLAKKIHDQHAQLKINEQALQDQLSPLGDGAVQLSDDQCLVFVSLYQADGQNMEKWAQQLRQLSQLVLTRPVYDCEEYVLQSIRSRQLQSIEAYAAVRVMKASVQSTDLPQRDRFDQPLLSLTERAVSSANIVSFHHAGHTYRWVDQSLYLPEKEYA